MRRCLPALLVATLPLMAGAGVYKQVQPDGSVVYTDRPVEGAEEVSLPELQTYSAPPLGDYERSAREEIPESGRTAPFSYEQVSIASPTQDQTLRDNGGNVSISLSLSPGLQPGHQVDILMDGTSIGSGAGTSVTLTNVDRGSHSLQAVVRDADGKELARTGSVTFHLLRASVARP